MTVGIDACLQEISGGLYDLQLDWKGDIQSKDFFDTSIIVSVFSEQRANESEVFESKSRRGWIGNESTPNFEIGSKVWLYEQSKFTKTVQNNLTIAIRQSLQWLIDDGFAVSIGDIKIIVTVTGISFEVTIRRPNSKVEKRHYILWENTALPCVDLPTYFQIEATAGMNLFNEIGRPNYPVDVMWNLLSNAFGGLNTGGPWHPESTIALNIASSKFLVGYGGAGGNGGGNLGNGNLGGGGGGGITLGIGGLSDDGAHNGTDAGTGVIGTGSVGAATGATSTHIATNGEAGLPALTMQHDISIINNSTVVGGSGGGGGGGADIGTGGDGSAAASAGLPGTGTSPGAGGAAGPAILTNGYNVTFIETGTIVGAIT